MLRNKILKHQGRLGIEFEKIYCALECEKNIVRFGIVFVFEQQLHISKYKLLLICVIHTKRKTQKAVFYIF